MDKIELTLQEYFKNENYQPGDPIPKEMDLAKAMGVSRTAIREALSRFKLLGIISSKKNRGMIITKPDLLGNMDRVLNSKLLDGQTMREIFELRLVIEMGLGDILFLRKNEQNLAELEEIVEHEEQTNNAIEKMKFDVQFHSNLYKISENSTILRFQNMLLPIFLYVNEGLHIRRQEENDSYVSHRVLLNILKNGTPEEFRIKMRAHLMQYFEKV